MTQKKNIEQTSQRIDLHVHSTHSDGTFTPAELIDLARKKRIAYISITDHDTVSGLMDAAQRARQNKVGLVPGIEISAFYPQGTLHILGYGIDPQSQILKNALVKQQKSRAQRNKKIIQRLSDLGIDLSQDKDLFQRPDPRHSLGRPHIAVSLIKKNIVGSIDKAFDEYLGKGGKAYVEKELLHPEEIIMIIRKSGGISFIAHPITLRLNELSFLETVGEMKSMGLDGIEVYSSSHSKKQISFYKKTCQDKGLLVSGGSDFHGHNRQGVKLGICNAGKPLNASMVSIDLPGCSDRL